MNASNALASVLALANAALPLIKHGSEGLALGQAALKTVDDFRAASGANPDQVATYDATREALEKAVNDHATRTAASLGD